MDNNKSNIPNIQIDNNQEFTHEIKKVNVATYANKLISKIKINVPDNEPEIRKFVIDPYNIKKPLVCTVARDSKKYVEQLSINPPKINWDGNTNTNTYAKKIPFTVADMEMRRGEINRRKNMLTSINNYPKIDIELDDKINLKKW